MAFKGTSEIGSRDWSREEPALEALDEAFYELRAANEDAVRAGVGSGEAPSARLQRLEARFLKLQGEAAALSVPNAFGSMLQNQGGSGLNANTSQDQTK